MLIAFSRDEYPEIAPVSATLTEAGMESELCEITTQWETELPRALAESTHCLIVPGGSSESNLWFSFTAGFCLGKRIPFFVFAPDHLGTVPAYLNRSVVSSSLADLSEFLRQRVADWRREEQAARARAELERSGISFSEEAFCETVREGEVKAVRLFLEAGYSPNIRDKNGVPVLSLAVRNQHGSVVKMLIQAGADVNVISDDRGNTPLMDAAAVGSLEFLGELVDAGADTDVASKNGQTALILAVGQNALPLVERLVAAGADAAIEDNLGMSAAKYAKLFNQSEILECIAGGSDSE
jgi:uncharacterized protein